MPVEDMKKRVFISHNHKDKVFCRSLALALNIAGAEVWYDEHTAKPGRLTPLIKDELQNSSVFLLVLSNAALKSKWVKDETEWFYNLFLKEQNRILLPILIEKVENDKIWDFLRDFKRIEEPGIGPYPQHIAIRRTLITLELFIKTEEPAKPLAPRVDESVDQLQSAGVELYKLGKTAEALPLLERATQIDSASFYSWNTLGTVYHELGRFSDALAAFDHATVLYPGEDMPWHNKSCSLMALGRYQDALDANSAALKTAFDSNNAQYWGTRGSIFMKMGRFQEALKAFNYLLSFSPNDIDALYCKGQAIALSENLTNEVYLEGLEVLGRHIQENPNDTNAWIYKAMVLLRLERYADALNVLEGKQDVDPNDMLFWEVKGKVLNSMHRYKEGQETYLQGLSLNPHSPYLWHHLAESFRQEGKLDEAMAAIDRELALVSNAEAWLLRGLIFHQKGMYDQAVASYEQALLIDPNDTLVWVNKALVLKNLEVYEEALLACEHCLSIERNDSKRAIIWYVKAGIFRGMGRNEAALEATKKAQELYNDPQLMEFLKNW